MAWSEFYMQATASNLNAGSTAADAAVYTSTAGNWDGTSVFTPTDGQTTTSLVSVGDWASIYPTGNTTTPYVAQVTAVGAGVNGTITVSTTAKFGTAPTSNSGSRACRTGGAWADLGMVASGVALNTGTVAQSTRINIKAGTYASATTARAFALAGAETAPLWWRGYKTAIGDQDANGNAAAGTDIPSWTSTTGAVTITGAHQIFSSIDIQSQAVGASGAVAPSSSSLGLRMYRIRITNTAANANGKALTTNGQSRYVACYFKSTATATYCITDGAVCAFVGCSVVGGIIGRLAGVSGSVLDGCIFDSQAGDAIQFASGLSGSVLHCSIYNPTGNGVAFATSIGTGVTIIANNYFENVAAGKVAITNTSGTSSDFITCVGNVYYNSTLPSSSSGITEGFLIFDGGTLGSAGFVAPGSQNFALNAAARGVGFPGANQPLENLSTTVGYASPGAVQPQSGGGPASSGCCSMP